MSNEAGFNRFAVSVNGEALRGALTLRLKEYDRHIARGDLAIKQLEADVAEAERLSDNALQNKRQRAVMPPVMHGMGMMTGGSDSVGISNEFQVKQQLDRMRNALAQLQQQRQQLQWLVEQIDPAALFALNVNDMAALNIGSARAAFAGVSAGYDPFEI